jgi:hypothetical protein
VKNRRFWILISALQSVVLFAVYSQFSRFICGFRDLFMVYSQFIRSLFAIYSRFVRFFRVLFVVNSRLLENLYDNVIEFSRIFKNILESSRRFQKADIYVIIEISLQTWITRK